MDCRKRLTPGMNGTKRYQQRFGERRQYVHYRHNSLNIRRLATVELIVDEAPLPPRSKIEQPLPPHLNQSILVRVDYQRNAE